MKPKDIRKNHYTRILEMLLSNEALEISEIADSLHLSKTTVAKLMNTLVDKQCVLPAGKGDSTDEGGKKPQRFEINAQKVYFIAAMYSAPRSTIEYRIYDLRLGCVANGREPVERRLPYEQVIRRSARLIRRAIREMSIADEQVYAVAYCGSGIIDAQNGIVIVASLTDWPPNLHFRDDLKKELALPCEVYFDNASRYLGLSEMTARNLPADMRMATIYSSEAIGGSIVRDGAIETSRDGFIGEFAFLLVDPQGAAPLDRSFNARASATALLDACYSRFEASAPTALAAGLQAHTLSPQEVFSAANAGDAFACQVVDEFAHWFAVACINIAYINDTDLIVIQGDFATAGPRFIEKLREEIESYENNVFPYQKRIQVEYSVLSFEHGRSSGFLNGAAIACRKEWLANAYNWLAVI